MTRFDDVLNGQEGNYILPFIWQKGESEEIIREEMARIYDSGIRAVCVESRPHPDYLGPQWWSDVDLIMEEARSRGMKVWMFDDSHFPTGYANGKVKEMGPENRRIFLQQAYLDAMGPQPDASVLVKHFLIEVNFLDPSAVHVKELFAVIAARREEASEKLTGEFVDITENVSEDGVLYWSIPEGFWRIFVITLNDRAGSPRHMDYVNVLDPESVRILIDEIYEPHYEHYRDDFGDTFAGFFSDEPGFYNDKDTFNYDSTVGTPDVDLLWHRDLLQKLSDDFGQNYKLYLPLLWHQNDEWTPAVRYTYMNVVSRLYGENFTMQLGDWCRAHDVEYIGHVLEDNGVHARLGCGPAHYFRALWGQDMSGLDVVLWQLVPGFGNGPFKGTSGEADGQFFHFGLGKLGSSLAHIDPKKKGRAMCEVYGAYGWAEGLKLMKWMTDHLLVRGVNYFIPHAFSQKEFPDMDCPPHFYARGKNPQYRYYNILNHYINRISHLISGGKHIASAAVLYHAEAEWAGEAMPFEAPVRELSQHQIDCDVLPIDVLLDAAKIVDQQLVVTNESYRCLVLPTAAPLPEAFLSRLVDFAQEGLPIYFVNGLPNQFCEGGSAAEIIKELSSFASVSTVQLENLSAALKEQGYFDLSLTSAQPDLRSYHVQHQNLDVYLFFNEHPLQSIQTGIVLSTEGKLVGYDGLSNQLFDLKEHCADGKCEFQLSLSPYQTLVVIQGNSAAQLEKSGVWLQEDQLKEVQTLQPTWSVSLATSEEYPDFKDWKAIEKLVNLNQSGLLPRFSGTFRYTGQFNWDGQEDAVWLDLGEVYETAEVWLNGSRIGAFIAPPYRVEVSDLLRQGENELVVEVTNTLVKDQHDFFSRQMALEPGGLLGPVTLKTLQ